VNAIDQGGAGGNGLDGANGGGGASTSLINAVAGDSFYYGLTLDQEAQGGAGGASAGGVAGRGGSAVSDLTASDTVNGTPNYQWGGTETAIGGAGGAGTNGSNGGAGGSASANVSLTGVYGVADSAVATAGAGGAATGGGAAGLEGTANAAATAITQSHVGGPAWTQYENAVAVCSAIASGRSGAYSATAGATLDSGDVIEQVTAIASGVVDGASEGVAGVGIGTEAYTTDAFQALASVRGAPSGGDVGTVTSGNSVIAAALGGTPTVFGLALMGGAYSIGGTKAQTTTATINETVNLALLGSRQTLIAGLYGGSAYDAAGVSRITFKLLVDGVVEVSKTWSGAGAGAAATAYFTNDAIYLGSLAQGSPLVGSNANLALQAVMTVTTTAAGGGFYGDVLFGQGPPRTPGVHTFAQAAAGFGSGTGSVLVAGTPTRAGLIPLLAVGHPVAAA
jgi:hypothetical protein